VSFAIIWLEGENFRTNLPSFLKSRLYQLKYIAEKPNGINQVLYKENWLVVLLMYSKITKDCKELQKESKDPSILVPEGSFV
jgi:hypothetical protein